MGSIRGTSLLAALLGVVIALLMTPAAAHALPPTLTVVVPGGHADDDVVVALSLVGADGPLEAAELTVERQNAGVWEPVATVVTDINGAASVPVTVSRVPANNVVRATWAGDGVEGPVTVEQRMPLLRRVSKLTLKGPRKFVDETKAKLTATWRADGRPVAGKVTLQRRVKKRWKAKKTKATGADGVVTFKVSPRKNSVWRVKASAVEWATRARSKKHKLRNLPPGVPVKLPRKAPRPRIKLPAQKRAQGKGANPVVTRIPTKVWRQMVGRSWHPGCPVGRGGLRLLRINYWDYDGYRRRGELVAAAGSIGRMAGALTRMYNKKLPIRSMYRVDRFGWSKRLQGADDYKSMAAGNTSAFNCRHVVGRPGVRSPHSSGRALDVNPWENPYRASHGWTPNAWWVSRAHPRVAWRSRSHPVMRAMAAHGMRWTYGMSDIHHFDAAGGGARRVAMARLGLPSVCEVEVCH